MSVQIILNNIWRQIYFPSQISEHGWGIKFSFKRSDSIWFWAWFLLYHFTTCSVYKIYSVKAESLKLV